MQLDETAIRLVNLEKKFGNTVAVDRVNLEVRAGEFFSMLGPSGSGKTTVLRLIAGFESPTSGSVELFGTDVTSAAPFDRDVNTVFQDYALFPHMTVQQNVEYGLRVRGVARKERSERAMQALEMVQLAHLATRKPSQLSGGQRQRVALARAIVLRPKVLLLDEPLGALDLKLREQMQVELKSLQRALGITFIFVTHDQEEALSLSDRVAVFNNGRIEQLGSPRELYENPQSKFVAGFVGTSNIYEANIAAKLFAISELVSVRPERIALESTGEPEIQLTVKVDEVIYAGESSKLICEIGGAQLILSVASDGAVLPERGANIEVFVPKSALVKLGSH